MNRVIPIFGVVFGLLPCASSQCPATPAPNPPFVPPFPYRTNANSGAGFLYGSTSLWTWISTDPDWWRGPACCRAQRPYVAKLAYMRAGFNARKEPDPELTVVARRLDVVAPLVWAGHANATWGPGEDNRIHLDLLSSMSMLTGIDLPAAGCWEIAARYKDRSLSYVVLVKP
jgi:hypothetical protein